ncbi:MAG: hypothetical protein ACJ704_09050 [Nitrososphaeraceae archaeon]
MQYLTRNPINYQTITIDSSAVRFYLRNHSGDTLGARIATEAAAE